jgi:glutamyl-Q tRNA(Asp) synthetase
MTQPVFRFAPSPNGPLHLGHALSALLNRDMAEEMGGRFLLRIEDIDTERSRPEFEASILDDLSWLGLRWERPVRRQSEHFGEYVEALETLKARGLVYPCTCTRGEIRAAIAAKSGWPNDPDGTPIYPGTCRPPPGAMFVDREPAWRLNMTKAIEETGPLAWTEIRADGSTETIMADPAAWGDVVLARRDTPTSYHLSVTLDDALQGVTHVVRGQDLYAATAVHRVLQTLLGLPEPIYRHHRLILGADGRKLSKSAGSEALHVLRSDAARVADIRRLVGL